MTYENESGPPAHPAFDASKDSEFEAFMQRAKEARDKTRQRLWDDSKLREAIARTIDGRLDAPTGAGDMPLANAGMWIAYRGGAIDVTDRNEANVIDAFEDLLGRLERDGAMLTGRNAAGRDEKFPASNLKGLELHYFDTVLAHPAALFTDAELNELFDIDEARWREANSRREFWDHQNRLQPGGEFGFIEVAFCPDGYHWNRHVNDKLFRAGSETPLWTNIQVSREFVRTRWPFHLHGNHSAAVQLNAYADVAKQYEDEGRRRCGLDRRAKRSERIEQRLAAPVMRDRAFPRL